MPPKRAVEGVKSTEECILQIGKFNNIIKWRESMQTIVTELYGIVGMFFTTDVRYELPRTILHYPDASSSEDSTSESEPDALADEDEEPAAEPTAAETAATLAYAAGKPTRAVAREVRNERRRKAGARSPAKYREEDCIQRQRDLKAQKENECTVYPMMWKRMSPSSQNRVKEEEEFRTAYMILDCVLLWTLIRKTHLTHK